MTSNRRITHETTFWCGLCATWVQLSAHLAYRDARANGWKITKHGILCPDCAAVQKQATPAGDGGLGG